MFDSEKFKDIIEYNEIKDILGKASIVDQRDAIRKFCKETPKEVFGFSKPIISQYLDYMKYKGHLANSLKKINFDWTKVLLKIDSILKILHYTYQIPPLAHSVNDISKNIIIPKRHLSIIRLTAYVKVMIAITLKII